MKKIIALTLAIAFVLSAAGCGKGEDELIYRSSKSESDMETKDLDIGITPSERKTSEEDETYSYNDISFEQITFSIREDYKLSSDNVWINESGSFVSAASFPDALTGTDNSSIRSSLSVYAAVDDMKIKEWTEVEGQQAVISASDESTNLLFFVDTKLYILVCGSMEEEEMYRVFDSIEINEFSADEQTFEPVKDSVSVGKSNALESAKSYIKYDAFSYESLVDQLEFEGYTHEEAVYGADNCGADWYEEAAECAQSYMKYSSFSRSDLYDQLIFEDFTPSQAEYGLSAVGY